MAVLVLAAAVAVLYGLWLILFPTPRFPEPTGPRGIGTRIYSWTDTSRPEPFTADRGDHRRLVVQLWYPAQGTGPRQPYIDQDVVTAALAGRFGLPPFLFRNIRNAPTHAVADAPAEDGRFPVLINPTGFLGFRSASLFWIEDLVSHGYVVVGLDQPGTAAATLFPDGVVVPLMSDKAAFDRYMPLALSQSPDRTPEMNGVPLPGGIIPFLAEDLSFVLDALEDVERTDPMFAGQLDLGRVGVFGVSLGGYAGAEACRRDQRFRACLSADSGHTGEVAREGLDQSVMIMSRDADVMRQERDRAGGWPEAEIAHTIGAQRALFENNRGAAYYVTMNGMHHVNWTDAPIFSPIVHWMGLAGPIDPYRGFAEINAFTVAFFDSHLKGHASPLLEKASDLPAVRLEVRPSE